METTKTTTTRQALEILKRFEPRTDIAISSRISTFGMRYSYHLYSYPIGGYEMGSVLDSPVKGTIREFLLWLLDGQQGFCPNYLRP